ncbi:hypothetical protein [Actinomyces sp. oral taxon 448]|nr:hypothetical protein [Actinomyces sp. oral taxon 448]EGQ72883.1 hypothetical protein HMPREF9062_2401 [Actinomyces sp. oral taxon 448 str. F0400]
MTAGAITYGYASEERLERRKLQETLNIKENQISSDLSSIDDLTTAEDSQKEDPGIDAEPDTPEYDWKDESQW